MPLLLGWRRHNWGRLWGFNTILCLKILHTLDSAIPLSLISAQEIIILGFTFKYFTIKIITHGTEKVENCNRLQSPRIWDDIKSSHLRCMKIWSGKYRPGDLITIKEWKGKFQTSSQKNMWTPNYEYYKINTCKVYKSTYKYNKVQQYNTWRYNYYNNCKKITM